MRPRHALAATLNLLLLASALAEPSYSTSETCGDDRPPAWSLPPFQLPGHQRSEVSQHPLLIGASPGTTGTMSLYYALKALGVGVVHYTRQFNASSGLEQTSYASGGGPVPLLRPLFRDTQPAPPVELEAARTLDLRFLDQTDALLDTPAQEIFFDLLATFPSARAQAVSQAAPCRTVRSRPPRPQPRDPSTQASC